MPHLEIGSHVFHPRKTGRHKFPPPTSLAPYSCLCLNCPKMIFKSPPCSRMLFQGFHLQCIEAPPELTDSTQLEGIEDIRPADVDEIKRWIERGTTPGKVRAYLSPSLKRVLLFPCRSYFRWRRVGGSGFVYRQSPAAPFVPVFREECAGLLSGDRYLVSEFQSPGYYIR